MEQEYARDYSDDRVSTGIEGLDAIIDGGVPEQNLILLSGGPGTGKTTTALHFLVEGAQRGDRGLFISLEEQPGKILRDAGRMDIGLQDQIDAEMIEIMRPDLHRYDAFKTSVDDAIRRFDADRVVIDSVAILGGYFDNEYEIRHKIVELKNLSSMVPATVHMVSEVPVGDRGASLFGVEEFAADGIIRFYHIDEGNTFERGVSVLKMRGSDHSDDVHPLQLGEGGVRVVSDERVSR